MKKCLHLLLLLISSLIFHASFAQVTLISDNTNINSGLVLPNGRPVLFNDAGLLYTTNGTSASVITSSVFYNNDSSSSGLYKNELYFSGETSSHDIELWASDGTSGGTRLVKNISATGSSTPGNFFVFNNTLYFTADDSIHGNELWSTDGTTGNTKLVIDINGKATTSFGDDVTFFVNGSYVLFNAYNSDSTLGLYKLTASGVSLIKNNFSRDILLNSSLSAAAFGNKTIFTVDTGEVFTGNSQLWVTDGTAANTKILKDYGANSSSAITQPFLFKGKIYFVEVTTSTGFGLWSTDGTPGNTTLVKTIAPITSSAGFPIIAFGVNLNDKFLFTAGTDATGTELWSTDGTAANTKILKDINPGPNSSSPTFLSNIGALQSLITAGNFTTINFHQFYVPYKGKVYFSADDGTHGIELWSTDGTAANTLLIKDINATGDGVSEEDLTASYFTTTGIYFTATDGTTGVEPWVTDGTSAGTNRVFDVKPGKGDSDPQYQFIYNSQLYFTAQNSGTDTDLYKINTSLTALPVNISSFTASLQSSSVLLNWTTATELNTDHFGVERSVDAAHFEEIGKVAATGNSSSAHTYDYNDYNALHIGSSVLYYRLKSTDKDGKFTYSPILKVQLRDAEFSYNLSPNPVRNQLTVSFTTINTAKAVLKITDGNGKAVYEKSLQSLQAGSVQQNINVASFASGIYYVQLITDSNTKTLKFVKQ